MLIFDLVLFGLLTAVPYGLARGFSWLVTQNYSSEMKLTAFLMPIIMGVFWHAAIPMSAYANGGTFFILLHLVSWGGGSPFLPILVIGWVIGGLWCLSNPSVMDSTPTKPDDTATSEPAAVSPEYNTCIHTVPQASDTTNRS